MKSFYLYLVLLVFTMQLKAQTYSGGSGTETDPYLISSKADMEALANAVNNGTNYSKDKYFLLTQNLTGINTVIGNSSTPTQTFQGIFDGNGHTVGLSIVIDNRYNGYAGIFGYCEGAFVKNLGASGSVSLTVTSGSFAYNSYAGGIIGNAVNTTITNCSNTGIISSTSSNSNPFLYSGGICGYSIGSIITNCYNTGTVSSYFSFSFRYNSYFTYGSSSSYSGGICGYGAGVTTANCYNTGTVSSSSTTSPSYSGGIYGYATGNTITNCYNIGVISSYSYYSYPGESYLSSYSYAGGISGYIASTSIENCYNKGNILADSQSSNIYYYAGGICGIFDFTSIISNCIVGSMTIQATNSPLQAGRIIGSGNGVISNCYALTTTKVNGTTINSTDATSKDGTDGDITSFQSQSWITTNLAWSFENTWNMPNSSSYPLLKKLPNIQISNRTITYGETATITSDNASTEISYSVSDNTVISIQNNIVTPLKVGTVTITAMQASENEWASASKTIVLTINKKQLTITANSTSMIYGDTPPVSTCQYSGFVNSETEAVLTTLPTTSCNATSTSDVGVYAIVPSGAAAQNYSFTYENGTLTITKRLLTVTPANTSRVYGNANPSFTLTYSGFVNGNTSSVVTTSPTIFTTATLTSNVGTYDIICSGGNATNYSFSYQTGILTVTKATLTAVADNSSRAYGESNPIFTISYYGFRNSDSQNSLTQVPYAICQATASSVIGNYPIVLSDGNAQNYDFSLMNGTLTINRAIVVVTASSASSVYGENPPTFSCQYSGFVNSETEAVLTTLPTTSCNATSTSDVGAYAIVPSSAAAQNYSFTYENGALTVIKRPLTVTPDNNTREYGSDNPSFTVSYAGFVNGDNEGAIYEIPNTTTTASLTSNVGSYDINCSGGSATNYSFIYQTGTLTVIKASLTAIADNNSREYGGINPSFTISYYGFRNTDNENSLTQIPNAICQAVPTSVVGDYPIVLSGGTAQNYDFSLVNGTLTINKATVFVTANSASSVYGENPPAYSCQYSGFVNSETEAVLTTLPTISCDANLTSDVGTYAIVPFAAEAQNYVFSYQNGTLTVTKRQILTIPDNASREYGAINPSFSVLFSGFVNGDNQESIDIKPIANTTATQASDVGTYDITCSGGVDENYSFAYESGVLTINKAPLTIAAYNATREQGQANPVFTYSYSGFKNNENKDVLNELPVASCAANENSPIGYYEIILSGGNDNNYAYTLVNGTLEVTPSTGVEDVSSNEIQIYPNPVCNELYFKTERQIENVMIYDIRGKHVMSIKLTNSVSINVSQLPQGIYILNILSDNNVITRKIIKE